MARWRTERHLQDHYRIHRHEFGGLPIEDYDASAQRTLDVGTYFKFYDDDSGEWRTGCYGSKRWAADRAGRG